MDNSHGTRAVSNQKVVVHGPLLDPKRPSVLLMPRTRSPRESNRGTAPPACGVWGVGVDAGPHPAGLVWVGHGTRMTVVGRPLQQTHLRRGEGPVEAQHLVQEGRIDIFTCGNGAAHGHCLRMGRVYNPR